MEKEFLDYLIRIPDELKIKIFSYLSTYEQHELCQMEIFQHLSCEKSLINNISIYKEYRFGIDKWKPFVGNKCRAELITSLNITCVYWIPARDIRSCLGKMRMLKSLYALDTKLGYCSDFQSLLHLDTLAITVMDHELENDSRFPHTIVNLCLHLELFRQNSVSILSNAVKKLDRLEKLWLIDMSPNCIQVAGTRILGTLPKSVRKLTLMVHDVFDIAMINKISFDGTLTFKNYRLNNVQLCYEKMDVPVTEIYTNWNYSDPAWDTLINRLKYIPFCRKDAKRLTLRQRQPEDLMYEEINITHPPTLCNVLFQATVGSLLLSNNMQLLKKLSVNFCLCEQNKEGVEESDNTPLFKKARTGARNALPNKSALEKIIDNSPCLEELELWSCKMSRLAKITNAALDSIQNVTNLKKLTLNGVPEHLNGNFLISILKCCDKLNSLRIKGGSISFQNSLCRALTHASALKDFRYENFHIEIDKIMAAFNENRKMRLARLMLKSKAVVEISISSLTRFLARNPQLRFLFIMVMQMPRVAVRSVSYAANGYRTGLEQIFIVTNSDADYKGRTPIPHFNKTEMVSVYSNVAVLDIFNGFATS